MKRTSVTIFLESPYGASNPTVTSLPWVNDAPDFSAFTEPTLSVLQKAWNDFVASGESLEIIPDPEPIIEQVYKPAQFLQDMFASNSFETWLSNFSNFKQSGFMNVATNAKVDNDWSVVQNTYTQLKSSIAPNQADIDEWQTIADTNGIPLTF